MNQKPKASIIIPAHNEAEFIEKTLTAASSIDYPDFEIVVVENGSSDDTFAVAQRFAQSHPAHPIRVIHEERHGVQFARQAGYLASTGDIVAFLDADCLPSRGWLSRIAEVLGDGYAGISGPYYYEDGGRFFANSSLAFQKTYLIPLHWFVQTLGVGGVMIFGNSATTRKNLAAIGGINTSIKFYGDDTDLAKQLSTLGPVLFDTKLIMTTSARRFQKRGLLRTTLLYGVFFFWETFLKSSYMQCLGWWQALKRKFSDPKVG